MLCRADMVTSLMFIKGLLEQPSPYLEFDKRHKGSVRLINVIKGVFVSFVLIIVTIIINAVNHKYPDRPSWDNLRFHKSGFI